MTTDGLFATIRETAERTPDERERHVDLVRAVSISLVVLGHWIVIVIVDDNGLDGVNAIGEVGWFHPLTWVFQVMPLFFFVGGYSNAASLASHRRKGGDEWRWVADRFRRIVVPTAALLAVLVVTVGVARLAGTATEDVSLAAWFVTVPMWFLLAYLAVCALAPWLDRAHERAGLWLPALLAAAVVMTDATGLALGLEVVRQPNHLLVYVAFHQLGVAWRQGDLRPTPAIGLPVAVGALAAAVALVTIGPYPIAMVDEPGADLQNSAPPTLAYLCLGVAQIGIVLACRDRTASWLQRRRVWILVVAVNGVILTVFLWHVAAALIAGITLHGLGILPEATIGSAGFMVLRLPWIAASLSMLVVLVALFAPIERAVASGGDPDHRLPTVARVLVATGVVGLIASMAGVAATGPGDEARFGLPTWSIAVFAAGLIALLTAQRWTADDDK